MHLIPKSKLYGQPALHIRDFMRHVAFATFDEAYIGTRLQVSTAEALVILQGLLADERIGLATPNQDGTARYGITAKGGQLAAASFAPQITRAHGERLLAGVLARAADVEAQRPFAFRLVRLALFGSMLSDTTHVTDVDLAIQVVRRLDGARFDELCRQRIKIAEDAGIRFRSRVHSIVWPRQEVTEYLRGGERYISLHSFTELESLACPLRILWSDPWVDPI